MMLNIAPTGAAITKRFFLVLEVAISQRRIRGIKTFTDRHGINYWNFSTLKKEQNKRMLKPEWLAYVVEDFDINAEWLLTGLGNMFKNSSNTK